MTDLREEIANVLYGELSDDGEVHPYDERWYRAADAILAIPAIAERLSIDTGTRRD